MGQPAGMVHTISVEGLAEPLLCADGQTLLGCMETRPRRSLTVGCKGGGCGVCKVEIVSGQYHTRRMSRAHVSAEDEAEGVALACRVLPMSDLSIRVIGLLGKRLNRRTAAQDDARSAATASAAWPDQADY